MQFSGTAVLPVLALAAFVLAGPSAECAGQQRVPTALQVRDVFVVGNNWDGTADFFDAKTFEHGPHENTYIDNGKMVVHTNIGALYRSFSFFVDVPFSLPSVQRGKRTTDSSATGSFSTGRNTDDGIGLLTAIIWVSTYNTLTRFFYSRSEKGHREGCTHPK